MTGAEAAESRIRLLPDGVKEATGTSIPKDWRTIARQARKAGWAVFSNGAGKLEWRGPNGERVTVPMTGHMNGKSGNNYRQQLKKAGVPGA